jgi:eukaryotic-like serine/threonine-protein kinase
MKTMSAHMPQALDLRAGLVVDGRYELVRVLGRGGMGEVWSAQHLRLRRHVAIKFVTLDHPDVANMLLAEAQVLASLRHPAIVSVFDCGVFGQAPYLVMEQLQGETLAEHLRREGPLDSQEAVRMMHRIALGLVEVHAASIVHRDIKPGNILLDVSGGSLQAKLIDFGIANAAVSPFAKGPMGTPPYMAPEQLDGAPATPAADIWALGVTLYELCVGQAPFADRATIEEVLRAVANDALPYPRITPALPKAIWQLLTSMTRKRPEDRPSTMQAVANALEQFSGRPTSLSPSPSGSSSASLFGSPAQVPSSQSPRAEKTETDATSLNPPSLDELIKTNL